MLNFIPDISLGQVAFPLIDIRLLWISINLGKKMHNSRPV